MSDFDSVGERYEELVERSIAFSGRDHGFFLDAKARALEDVVRRFVGALDTLQALDVGCGAGAMHPRLAFAQLAAVDPSQELIRRAAAANPEVEYRVADGTALPYDDGSFDVTFTVCVLHHVEAPARPKFAAELARVTRRGGLAVVFEHNPLNPLTRLAVARCEFDEDADLLGRRALRRLLAPSLRAVESRYLLFVPWHAPRLERMLAPLPLGAQYYVAATAA
jgi:SAM-dependent methyltransferase